MPVIRKARSASKAIQRNLTAQFEVLARNPEPPLPAPYNPTGLNPAQMTFEDYYKSVNKQGKWHDSDSYKATIKSLNFGYDKKRDAISLPENYKRFLQRKVLRGVPFDFRLKVADTEYGVRKTSGEGFKSNPDGSTLLMTREQIKAKGLRENEFTVAAFNPEGLCVGRVQDEWGAMLVWVADEYKGFGIGPLLTKYARKFEPTKDSGGFTSSGRYNLQKVHREAVRDALTQGLYREWIKKGLLTPAQVFTITNSADLATRPKMGSDISSSDPKNWMLYSDFDYGSFIIYDKKLKEFYNTGDDNARWAESMVKGAITVYELNDPHPHAGIINLFGTNNPKIAKFLFQLAGSYCAIHGIPLYVDPDDMKYISEQDFDIQTPDMTTGISRTPVRIKKVIPDVKRLGLPERIWRKGFDKYDELLNGVLELAHAKYRYNQELTAMQGKELNAALSFMSTKQLDKKYSALFNKMTIGFEAEISGGDSQYYPGDEADFGGDDDGFEFSFSEQEFLNKFSTRKNAVQMLEAFDIVCPYGFAGSPETLAVRDIWNKLSQIQFRVMGLPMENGNPIMEEPSLQGYQSPTGEINHFCLRDTRLFNVNFVISKAKENWAALNDFLEKCPIEKTRHMASNYVVDSRMDIFRAISALGRPEITKDPIETRRWIYACGLSIHKLKLGLEQFFKFCQQRGEEMLLIVAKTENGGLKLIQTDNYNDDGGILSEPLAWSPDSHELFKDEYETMSQEEEESQRAAYRDNAVSEGHEEGSGAMDAIYSAVRTSVDRQAELSKGYHNNDQMKGKVTVVEGDSSISPAGAEVVSRVYDGPVKALEWLDNVFDMIDDNDFKTNETTGLHVNIGTFRALHKAPDADEINTSRPVIDVLKLAILSGDNYLLEQFGRESNSYAKTIQLELEKLTKLGITFKNTPGSGKSELPEILKQLNKRFVDGQLDRYRTINMQHLMDKGYLEFRIAGGDDYHADKNKVRKAVYRYMQLCAMACDPQAYFKEYMTALYKLITGSKFTPSNVITKEPIPKNVTEAVFYLRQWSSNQYTSGNEGLNRAALEIVKDAVTNKENLREDIILDLLSGMNEDKLRNVSNNVLYSMRLLMLYAARNETDPKAALKQTYIKNKKSIADYVAPKLSRYRPQWIKFFFTGQLQGNGELTAMSKKVTAMYIKKNWSEEEQKKLGDAFANGQEITASIVPLVPPKPKSTCIISKFNDGDSILFDWPVDPMAKVLVSPKDFKLILGVPNQSSIKVKSGKYEWNVKRNNDWLEFSKDKERYYVRAEKLQGTQMAANNLEASDKQAAKDIVAFKQDLKSKRPELFKKSYSMAVLEDNYYTARSGGATDKEARVFCTKMLEGYSKVPITRLDTSDDIAPELRKQLAKYQRTAENKNKEWSKRKDEDLTTDLEAADGSYTNKSKSVKVLYYANRSTPQVVKPGQTVKAKAGYGKRTKIRSATADEVAQFKKGKWLRTREDGKAPNAKGSKQSKYRPQLAAKSRAAKRKKLAANDETGIKRYLDFMHGE